MPSAKKSATGERGVQKQNFLAYVLCEWPLTLSGYLFQGFFSGTFVLIHFGVIFSMVIFYGAFSRFPIDIVFLER